MTSELLFASANESQLNSLLAGQPDVMTFSWRGKHNLPRIQNGTFGVLCKKSRFDSNFLQPVVLVAREEEFRRLFGRFAQVRSDLSPLTTWCHLMTPKRFECFDEPRRDADLGGLEAAWTGLIIAESLLLSELPISRVKITACLATQSFAIGRTKALWGDTPINEILDRYDAAQGIFRHDESRLNKLRAAFGPIWTALAGASHYEVYNEDPTATVLIEGIRTLYRARQDRDQGEESHLLLRALESAVSDVGVLQRLPELTPEQRVHEFDNVMSSLSRMTPNYGATPRHVWAMLAGYLATVAAGGEPSLSLLEPHAQRWPEVTAWAYILGSVGEHVIWTSSFDGLGRLVARELARPMRLDESPACDFSIDEAMTLFDASLADPTVHLRIKQARIVTVSLAPGVNVLVPVVEPTGEARATESMGSGAHERVSREQIGPASLDAVTEAVWRRLRGRAEQYVETLVRRESGRSSKRPQAQSKLPLKQPGDK